MNSYRTREEACKFIDNIVGPVDERLDKLKHDKHHMGKQEMKMILDYIYGTPSGPHECLQWEWSK